MNLLTVAILLSLASLNCNALPNPMPSPLEADPPFTYSDAGINLKNDVGAGKGSDSAVGVPDLRAPRTDGEVSGLEDGAVILDAVGEGGVEAGTDALVGDALVGDALTADVGTEDGSGAPDAASEDVGPVQDDLGGDDQGR